MVVYGQGGQLEAITMQAMTMYAIPVHAITVQLRAARAVSSRP